MKKNKELMLAILAVLTVILITGGVTYAFFNYAKEGTTDNVITTDTITFLYTEVDGVGNGIKIENAFPMSDDQGKLLTKTNEYFDFKVTSKTASTIAIPYEVTARKSKDSDNIDGYIRVYLTKGETYEEVLLENYDQLDQTDKVDVSKYTDKVIYEDTVPANESNYEETFRLRMWIAEGTRFENEAMNDKTFKLTVNVYANAEVVTEQQSTYTETLLNGADPVLTANTTTASSSNVVRLSNTETIDYLIPVMIDSTGKVTKANINEKWYSYADKEWANAVILKDYNVVYENGVEIPESNIESYFVWIPKYSYQLWDLGNYTGLTSIESKERVINIRFGLDNTNDSNIGECTTPGVAGSSGNCSVVDGIGDYMTHPAFLAFNTNGFWVGKFETGFDGATASTTTEMNTYDSNKIIIKPNVYSWRNNTLGNMFKASLDYLSDYDSHMMKNTEWGAVGYLQHSIYGSATSVRVNNNSSYITGYAATVEPTNGYRDTSVDGNRYESTAVGMDGTYTVNYLNSASTVASTTGNYTGIYDISGGTHEYVMGYTTTSSIGIGGSSGITSLYSNFFTNSEYDKYYDKYSSTKETDYNNRILGDATGEMGPFGNYVDSVLGNRPKTSWYGDYTVFVNSSRPWFSRGFSWQNGSETGMFSLYNLYGDIHTHTSFRIVLAPTK